jgi:uncharacterized membrane protein YhaH (DUF805 family)
MFSFSGRITRFPFFLGCLALAAACFIPVIATLGLLTPIQAGNRVALILLIGLLILFAAAMLWISLALQTKRIRDIGWDPLIILPVWLVLQVADPILAHFYPALAAGKGGGETLLGGMVNLVLFGILLFWPSADYELTSSGPRSCPPKPNPPRLNEPRPAEREPIVQRALPASPAPHRTSFGRR